MADDVSLHFSEWTGARPKHRAAVFFHLCFRVLAIVVYLFCGLFSNSFISCFVTILILLSLDFWTVKNVTGRLLVGLRWWNYIDDEGQSHWVFESREGEDSKLTDPSESQAFWLALVLCPAVWFLLLFISIFRLNLQWFVVVIMALALNGANLYGYLRCKIGGTEKFTVGLSNLMGKQVLTNMFSTIFKKEPEKKPENQNFSATV